MPFSATDRLKKREREIRRTISRKIRYQNIITLVVQDVEHDRFNVAVVPGAWVRIRAPSVAKRWLVGSIVTLSADSLVLNAKKHTALQRISLTSVKKLEVSTGKKSKTGAGLFFGGILGMFFVYNAISNCVERCSEEAGGVEFLAAGSLLLGGVIGASVKGDRWQKVPLDHIRVGIFPQRQTGPVLSASFRF